MSETPESHQRYTCCERAWSEGYAAASEENASLRRALKLALDFWHSDHPNDTVAAFEAKAQIEAVLRSTS